MAENRRTARSRTRSSRYTRIITVITVVIGVISIVATVFIGANTVRNDAIKISEIDRQLRAQTQEILKASIARVAALEKRNQLLISELKKITHIPDDAKMASQLSQLDQSINTLNTKLSKLEQVILNDPAKALELPLLRNELENIKNTGQTEIISLRQEIARVYDLNKWFIGLMFTMALGILGLAVTNFIRVPRDEGN